MASLPIIVEAYVRNCCSLRWFDDCPVGDECVMFIREAYAFDIARRVAGYCRRNLFGTIPTAGEILRSLAPFEAYLERGATLLTGFSTGAVVDRSGALRGVGWRLDARDPLFATVEVLTNDTRSAVRLMKENIPVSISRHAWQRFHERAPESKSLGRLYSRKGYGSRRSLDLMIAMFRTAAAVGRQNAPQQAVKYGSDARYYAQSGWVFVVDETETLRTCYEKGKISEAGYTVLGSITPATGVSATNDGGAPANSSPLRR
jgi:hypothetical protein